MIPITSKISLQDHEIEEEFVRSSGPGGQNVNKVSTAVQLRFNVRNSPSLPEDVRARLLTLAGHRLTCDGVLLINTQKFRSQDRNRQEALEQLAILIRSAVEVPKSRRKTKPTRASQQRRLESKKVESRTKQLRRMPKNSGD